MLRGRCAREVSSIIPFLSKTFIPFSGNSGIVAPFSEIAHLGGCGGVVVVVAVVVVVVTLTHVSSDEFEFIEYVLA